MSKSGVRRFLNLVQNGLVVGLFFCFGDERQFGVKKALGASSGSLLPLSIIARVLSIYMLRISPCSHMLSSVKLATIDYCGLPSIIGYKAMPNI